MLREAVTCDNMTIRATNGIEYIACIPWSMTVYGKIYAWPLEIKVSGGTLKKSQTGALYSFVPNVLDIKSDKDANKKGGNGQCDNKIIHASNGIKYLICIPWSITSFGKIYSWPTEIKVFRGTLKRSQLNGGIIYTFVPDSVDKKGNGENDEESDEGNDNTNLMLGALAAFLLFKN
jgi:hypothetical protein